MFMCMCYYVPAKVNNTSEFMYFIRAFVVSIRGLNLFEDVRSSVEQAFIDQMEKRCYKSVPLSILNNLDGSFQSKSFI